MGVLLSSVSWVASSVHSTINVAAERDTNGNIYALRALEGATRIIRGIGAQFYGAEALVDLHSTIRPASSLYGAFSSVFLQWKGTVESVEKAYQAVYKREVKVTVKSSLNVSDGTPVIVRAPVEFKKTVEADWKDMTLSTLGAGFSVNAYIFGLTHTAAEFLKIEQVALVAGKAFRPLMAIHKVASRTFAVLNLTNALAKVAISSLNVHQAPNTLPVTELARLKAERYQALLGLVKTVIKVALLIFAAHFSLVAQGVMIFSTLALDIYMSRPEVKKKVEQRVEIMNTPNTFMKVTPDVYQTITA